MATLQLMVCMTCNLVSYDAQTGGSQKGQTVAEEDMDVIDGYFAVDLDFGEGMFDGNPRWLEIGCSARCDHRQLYDS